MELDARNRRCVEHYRECKAVAWQCEDGRDPLVRRHAAIIAAVEDAAQRGDVMHAVDELARTLKAKK